MLGKVRLEKDFVEFIPANRHESPVMMLPYGEALVPLSDLEEVCGAIRAKTFWAHRSGIFVYRKALRWFTKLQDPHTANESAYVPLALRKCLSEKP